jgi:hypothetical protein
MSCSATVGSAGIKAFFFDIFRIALFGGGLFLDEASGNTTSN